MSNASPALCGAESDVRGGNSPHTMYSDSKYPELHVVFDFFVDNPQKMMPATVHQTAPVLHGHDSTDQATAAAASAATAAAASAAAAAAVAEGQGQAGRRDNPFYDPYWESIRMMQDSDLFMEGMLLRSVDCKR